MEQKRVGPLSEEASREVGSAVRPEVSPEFSAEVSPEVSPEVGGPDAARKIRREKLRIGLAAVGTLSAVVGIAVVINGGLYFNTTKVMVGVGIIVVSTALYISMLFISRND